MVFKNMKITPDHKAALIESISKKMAQQPTKLRATFELNCFTYEGIDAIKAVLIRTKREVNDDQFQIDVSHPISSDLPQAQNHRASSLQM
jgi:translation initiation factor 2 subunit 1